MSISQSTIDKDVYALRYDDKLGANAPIVNNGRGCYLPKSYDFLAAISRSYGISPRYGSDIETIANTVKARVDFYRRVVSSGALDPKEEIVARGALEDLTGILDRLVILLNQPYK